ncbi:MAG: superoxide dismutase family protein [Proteobacteria bacterium]|nr:superoxide dismutase family protein [Cystobacterineae bacterium]MCL2259557.1 superoxide dismutase family protein [Cystobacterineae bacterium]MCL2314253.1 superoxide dismutase family protein [Pseudomonadota bacterium]
MKKLFVPFAVFIFVGLLAACATQGASVKAGKASAAAMQASAILMPVGDSVVQGSALFSQEADGIRLIADVSGLSPGSHGFHIHENGECSPPDAKSAGGHFNPHQKEHGRMGEGHAGDLPSLEADADGNAKLDVVLTSIELTGENGIVGRSLIVHADADDYVSQPTGNAGARVACAVIQ